VTDRQTDRQTDGQTEFSSLYRVCITCSAVKMPNKVYDFRLLHAVPLKVTVNADYEHQ